MRAQRRKSKEQSSNDSEFGGRKKIKNGNVCGRASTVLERKREKDIAENLTYQR